jgi:diacylglycerol O-acyltransferase
VDFGIIADKKALPHAKDLAKAIEDAFTEAQSLMAGAAPPPRPRPKNRQTRGEKDHRKAAPGKNPQGRCHERDEIPASSRQVRGASLCKQA